MSDNTGLARTEAPFTLPKGFMATFVRLSQSNPDMIESLHNVLRSIPSCPHRPADPLYGLVHLQHAASVLRQVIEPSGESAASGRKVFAVLRKLSPLWPQITEVPELSRDPIRYFLHQVTRAHAATKKRPPALRTLLPICTGALEQALVHWPQRADVQRDEVQRLPYVLAMFIHFFPTSRLAGERVIGQVAYQDIFEAFRAYRLSQRGIKLEHTALQYAESVAKALSIKKSAFARQRICTSDQWPELARYCGRSASGSPIRVMALMPSEADGSRRALLACPEQIADDPSHPLEEAEWIQPKGLSFNWSRSAPRSDWYPQIWDGTALTPNELTRLVIRICRAGDVGREIRPWYFLGLAAFTGIPESRLMKATIWNGPPAVIEEWLRKKEPMLASRTDDWVVICPKAGIIWLRAPESGAAGVSPHASPPLNTVRVPLPRILGPLANALWRGSESSPPPGGPFLQRRNGKPIPEAEVLQWLQIAGRTISPLPPGLTFARLRRTLKTYARNAGYSPLLTAVSSGSPNYHERVLLHYVSYPTRSFWERFSTLQSRMIELVGQVIPPADQIPLATDPVPPPSFLIDGQYGAMFTVDTARLKRTLEAAWRTLSAVAAESDRFNLLTMLTAGVVLAGTGIREKVELGNLNVSRFDPATALLRIQGKQSSFFREAREVPLGKSVTRWLSRYLDSPVYRRFARGRRHIFHVHVDGGPRPIRFGDLDRLICRYGLHDDWKACAPSHLRHWLRTQLELEGVRSEAVNDAFGHTTETTTVYHRLSSESIPILQSEFRESTDRILARVLPKDPSFA
ncbi:MAG: site-specific integrase [Nitrospirae bacterium]|nr:site-specific integrase [Nitrospirota bacterium]